MDGRRLPNLKVGQKLTAAHINALAAQQKVRPNQVRGFSSARANAGREQWRLPSIEVAAREDIEPYSVFHMTYGNAYSVIPEFRISKKDFGGWGIFTNGPVEIPEGGHGVVYALTADNPVLCKLTEEEDDKPKEGSFCGADITDMTVTVKAGGLIMLGLDQEDSDYGWCMKFNEQIDVLAKVGELHADARDWSEFIVQMFDLDSSPEDEEEDKLKDMFEEDDDKTKVKAFNIHQAKIASDEIVRLTLTTGFGLTATKYNGGMWIGETLTEIDGGEEGDVEIDDTEETVVVTAPPDGLEEGKKVNVIEYQWDILHAYPIEC